jgi:hypothetical protein
MLRFVVLHHHLSSSDAHYDLMLETEAGTDREQKALRTLATETDAFPGNGTRLRELPPHRRHYLDYEGEISDNRGTVQRADAGTWELDADEDGDLWLRLRGNRLSGRYRITWSDGEWILHGPLPPPDRAEKAESRLTP